ncbi:ArsR family transcriptional regulator [Halobacteria archaeon AArc-m2/3/4]|uniref:ArsR family transcriptional regulator n=1 Tax=Natronoglomus mannanivorans TaxID=2979990 RepID=A0ABT2QK75_9EURY|nr:ArsR family transcriptional regulator [Halobacteria archaeon AArc-m2/3/4]
MKLRQPTDFQILEALEETGRNVAANLESQTDKTRQNINTRLPVLDDYGLVEKIGPAERSGLYEITSDGKTALVYRERYCDVDDFESLIRGPEPDSQRSAATQYARGEYDDDADQSERQD